MFETLFTCPGALRRHRDGPLATERAAYLSELAAQGMARETILRRSSYCLCVAVELQRWPPDRSFDEDEIEKLAAAWAAERCACGRASSPRWPQEHFRFTATEFLRSIGRLCAAQAPEAGLLPGRAAAPPRCDGDPGEQLLAAAGHDLPDAAIDPLWRRAATQRGLAPAVLRCGSRRARPCHLGHEVLQVSARAHRHRVVHGAGYVPQGAPTSADAGRDSIGLLRFAHGQGDQARQA